MRYNRDFSVAFFCIRLKVLHKELKCHYQANKTEIQSGKLTVLCCLYNILGFTILWVLANVGERGLSPSNI